MKNGCLKVHNKILKIPSFFSVYNAGGGGGDKTRAVVYMDLFNKIPQLHNYYYLNLMSSPCFDREVLSKLPEYNDFSLFLKYMRKTLITEKLIYSTNHVFEKFDYDKTIYLLDSGSKNILYDIARKNAGKVKFQKIISLFDEEMIRYYDFANRHRFDIVVSFDTGGKYTFKDNEKSNENLMQFEEKLEDVEQEINKNLLIETIRYLKKRQDFYPLVLATIHGKTPREYGEYARFVLEAEKKYNLFFWGFALGGIASSKDIDKSWLKGYSKKLGISKNAFVSSKAAKIVHEVVGDRPIHALGAGGYESIDILYESGVTSFDSNTPNRRVGDGSIGSANEVLGTSKGKGKSIPKYLVGKVDSKLEPINPTMEQAYTRLNQLLADVKLCGCPACVESKTIQRVKELYANGPNEKEDFYLSRQLISAHSTWQHVYMCMKHWNDLED